MTKLPTTQPNLLDISQGIIVHLNLTGVMGTRIALHLQRQFPKLYQHYRNHPTPLGSIHSHWVQSHLCVVMLSAMDKQLNYLALISSLHTLQRFAETVQLTPYIPFGLGCGIIGGQWHHISQLITQHCPSAVIYKVSGNPGHWLLFTAH